MIRGHIMSEKVEEQRRGCTSDIGWVALYVVVLVLMLAWAFAPAARCHRAGIRIGQRTAPQLLVHAN